MASALRAEVVNPFVLTSLTYLDLRLLLEVKKGAPAVGKVFPPFEQGVLVKVGLSGQVNGLYQLALDREATLSVAGAMLLGLNVNKLDVMAHSALLEITQVMAGNAAATLTRQGLFCAITPPTLQQLPLARPQPPPTLTVPLMSKAGNITLGLTLTQGAEAATGAALASQVAAN